MSWTGTMGNIRGWPGPFPQALPPQALHNVISSSLASCNHTWVFAYELMQRTPGPCADKGWYLDHQVGWDLEVLTKD